MRCVPLLRSRCRIVLVMVALLLVGLAGRVSAATVAVIEIRAEISKGLEKYIERALADAEAQADVVVFDMHTPGGRVDVMGNIVNRIFESPLPTIAYVRTEAISAGAVIALACDQIVMAPGSTIGDAAPVSQAGAELGEKAISYIRGKIRAIAERNGRNPDIAEAMVDKKKVLVRIGETVEVLTPAQFEERREAGEEMEIISHEGELLTLTTSEALDLGLVERRASSLDELLSAYLLVADGAERRVMTEAQLEAAREKPEGETLEVIESLADATVLPLRRTLVENLAIAVTSSMLGSLLLSIGMLGLLIEFRTPGFGVPGLVGLFSIALFFGGHMIAEVQTSWGFVAFLIGLGLIALEIFVIPGFGIAGISGILFVLGGLLFVFGSSAPTLSAAVGSLGTAVLLTAVLAVVVGFALPKTRAWNRLVLETATKREEGFQAAPPELNKLVGRHGVAMTPLRPAGTAEIDGERVDVVTQGEFLPPNTPVRVVEVEGNRVVVRRDAEAETG